MNLTRVLQPYVCCLGNPVAGNPTQFVMYRTARACGVDWRFFTSQVEVDQFETAFHGVQALGLSGMAIFDPFQSKALPLLDSVTESAMCLGKVNVARLDGNSWLGDNTLGTGIINCIERNIETCIESDGGRLSSVLVIGEPRIAEAMRLASPEIADRILVVSEGQEANAKRGEVESKQTDVLHARELASIEAFAQSGFSVGCLVLAKVPNAILSRQIAALSWSSSASSLIFANTSDKLLRQWRDSVKIHNVTHIELVDWMAHQAAVDFHFRTGVMPAIDLIRDSFEEYLQW